MSKQFIRRSYLITFIASTLLIETAKAQVTIGSSLYPETAALLELKSQEADAKNITSTTGGMILSRVGLESLTTLEPFITPSTPDYIKQKRSHTGLLVYNVNSTDKIKPGLYIWDGDKWNMMITSSNSSNVNPPSGDPTTPTIPSFNEGAYLPNSYIVSPGSSINIPIVKAYSVWKNYLDKDLGMEDQIVTAELLWQDEKKLVSAITLKLNEDKYKSYIAVKTNSTMEGNAIVVVKMNGIIRWSWHLWVTEYNPNVSTAQECPDKENTFMNRYLGATSCDFGHLGSIGLLYQWGRKDPFSGSASSTSIKEKEHYDINNRVIEIAVTKERVTSKVNLPNSIVNPSTFYTGSTDWYSANRELTNNHMWTTESGKKGIYDPCPKGWRVPLSEKDENSVWDKLKGRGKHFDIGTGVTWEGFGYYHASGRRNNSGDLEQVGREAYVWSAKNFYDEQAYRLHVADWNVYPQHSSNKVFAQSIRCVKE